VEVAIKHGPEAVKKTNKFANIKQINIIFLIFLILSKKP
jgi:hypothetical protein